MTEPTYEQIEKWLKDKWNMPINRAVTDDYIEHLAIGDILKSFHSEFSAQQYKELIEQNQTASSTVEMVQAKYEELESELSKQKELVEAKDEMLLNQGYNWFKENHELMVEIEALKKDFYSKLLKKLQLIESGQLKLSDYFFEVQDKVNLSTPTPEPSEEREGKELLEGDKSLNICDKCGMKINWPIILKD